MGKSNKALANLYLIGMALVVIGFILPMFKSALGSSNGFDFINLKKFGFSTIGALLIFIGGAAGVVLSFVKGGSKQTKLIALAVSILGFIVLVIGFNDNALTKAIGKGFLKHAYIGFYLVVVGWVAAVAGYLKSN
ncbi:MAG: hypothetical protein Q4B64_05630 [Spirochaetales bacterium]|nr:hypothetical protein [Spirochaetales bacterium]